MREYGQLTRDKRVPTEKDLDKLADRAIDKALRKVDDKAAKKLNGPKVPSTEILSTASKEELMQYVAESLYWYNHEPVYSDDEIEQRLAEYFQRVQDTGEVPTVEKLLLALVIDKETWRRWLHGELGSRRQAMCKKAVTILQAIDASLVMHKKIPESTYIFRAKNYYGMRDAIELDYDSESPYSEDTPEQLRDKYLSAVPE